MENILLVRAEVYDDEVSADTQWLQMNSRDIDEAIAAALDVLNTDHGVTVEDRGQHTNPFEKDESGRWGFTMQGYVDCEWVTPHYVGVRILFMWGTPFTDEDR